MTLYIFAAVQPGACGYLLKTASSDEIVRGIHAVAEGESALSPVVARLKLDGG